MTNKICIYTECFICNNINYHYLSNTSLNLAIENDNKNNLYISCFKCKKITYQKIKRDKF